MNPSGRDTELRSVVLKTHIKHLTAKVCPKLRLQCPLYAKVERKVVDLNCITNAQAYLYPDPTPGTPKQMYSGLCTQDPEGPKKSGLEYLGRMFSFASFDDSLQSAIPVGS